MSVTSEIQRLRKRESIYSRFVGETKGVKFTSENKTGCISISRGPHKGLSGPFMRLYMDAIMARNLEKSDWYFPVVDDPSAVVEETVSELIVAGIPSEIAYKMCTLVLNSYDSAAKMLKGISSARDSHATITRVQALKSYHLSRDKTVLRITEWHFERLRFLYMHSLGSKHDYQVFCDRVFCVLARYEMLSKSTVADQGAVPKHVFKLISDPEMLGTESELFASPLNCYFSEFRSLYPDTDSFFGSRGSFFETWQSLRPGSYEANPPFILSVMEKMAVLIQTILESQESFTFFVIVPVWTNVKYLDLMGTSKHLLLTEVLESRKHEYVTGDQHLTGRRPQGTAARSQYFILSNDRARFGPQKIAKMSKALKVAFATRMQDAKD